MFSYSERVKSPECRRQRRRADLRQFQIFRHGPVIIYTRLPAGGTYYPICTFPANSECLIGISDAFSAFCLWVSVIFPTCSLYPQQKRAYSELHPQAWTYIYRSMPEGIYRVLFPGFQKIVYYECTKDRPETRHTSSPTPSVLVDFHTARDQPRSGWLPQTTRLLLCFGFHLYERPSELTQVVKFKIKK